MEFLSGRTQGFHWPLAKYTHLVLYTVRCIKQKNAIELKEEAHESYDHLKPHIRLQGLSLRKHKAQYNLLLRR